MRDEKKFQDKFLKIVQKDGKRVFHLSPPSYPGFFDLTIMSHDHRVFNVEVKDITGLDDKKMFKNCFTVNQFPFYLDWLNKSPKTPFFILIKDGDYVLCDFIDNENLMKYFNMNNENMRIRFKKFDDIEEAYQWMLEQFLIMQT